MPTASDEQMAAPPLGRQESGIKRPADAAAAAPASKEAKQEAAAAPAAEQQAAGEGLPPRKPSFKVMGHLVLAMKRFSSEWGWGAVGRRPRGRRARAVA